MARIKKETTPHILRLPWQRGEDLLTQGYKVKPMGRAWCFEVVRPTETRNPDGMTISYHVCIDEGDTSFGCDCPDYARNGDIRPCKHMMLVYVQIWRWSEESPLSSIVDFTPVLESLGIPAMREAALRSTLAASTPTPAPLPTHSHSGRPIERRDPREYQSRPWPTRVEAQKERVFS